MHSRTVSDVLLASQGYQAQFYMSHGLAIPDAQNYITEQALGGEANYFFFVEDDMQLPHDILDKLFAARADIAIADYPVRETQRVVQRLKGKVAWFGLGCTLIHRSVFERLDRPYFSVEREYQVQDDTLILKQHADSVYGIFDVDFAVRAMKHSSVKVVGSVGQYFLKSPQLPKWTNNSGLEYEVETWQL